MPRIEDYPLISIVEVMDMDSGDTLFYKGAPGTVEEIFYRKRGHIEGTDPDYPYSADYEDWGLDWKQEEPVIIERYADGSRSFRDGHHRATHAHDIGLLFLHYREI